MTTLNDLKTAYLTRQAEARAEAEAEASALRVRQRQTVAGFESRVLLFLAERENVDVDELNQFGQIAGNWNHWDEGRLERIVFTLSLPEHEEIRFIFDVNGDEIRPKPYWFVEDSRENSDTLGEALAVAANIWQKNQEWTARETAAEQAQQVARQEEENQERLAAAQMLEQIARDSAAVLLLKLFAEIQRERAELTKQIGDLDDALGSAEYRYDAALSSARRQIEDQSNEARQARDEARELEYRLNDLDDKFQKIKRQRH